MSYKIYNFTPNSVSSLYVLNLKTQCTLKSVVTVFHYSTEE